MMVVVIIIIIIISETCSNNFSLQYKDGSMFQIHTALLMRIHTLCDVMLCPLVNNCRRFEGT